MTKPSAENMVADSNVQRAPIWYFAESITLTTSWGLIMFALLLYWFRKWDWKIYGERFWPHSQLNKMIHYAVNIITVSNWHFRYCSECLQRQTSNVVEAQFWHKEIHLKFIQCYLKHYEALWLLVSRWKVYVQSLHNLPCQWCVSFCRPTVLET